jgi:hypothetical protein
MTQRTKCFLGRFATFHFSVFSDFKDDIICIGFNVLRTCLTLGCFLISNFRRVLYVVCFLLGNFPASEFYMPTFQNTLFRLHRQVGK